MAPVIHLPIDVLNAAVVPVSSSVCSSSGPRINRGIFLPRCCGRFL
ncbi:MAG: hypothetical protein ACK559_22300 [bacterium]